MYINDRRLQMFVIYGASGATLLVGYDRFIMQCIKVTIMNSPY